MQKSYDDHHAHQLVITPRMHEIINEVYKYLYNYDILDVGCGNGIITAFMRLHNRVKAIDLKTTGEDICTYEEPGGRLFDVITCFDVLEHIEELLKALNNISKLIKSKGLLLINLPEQKDETQPFDNLIGIRRLINRLRVRDFKLINLRWYAISENESYNLMVFKKVK